MPTIVGPIHRLQVQRAALKIGTRPHRVYEPAPICAVPALRATDAGVTGLTPDGEVLDIHHRDHPASRNDGGSNGISIGFTAHYAAMQHHFGPHMRVGCAGENIIVETTRRIGLDEASRGFLVLDTEGARKCRLGAVAVAHPCKPFSGYALGGAWVDAATLKATLQFLDGGMRGFYCSIGTEGAAPAEVTLAPGDLLALDD